MYNEKLTLTSVSEIPIVGAGPAGLVAAITIAKAKGRAVLYERQRDVGGRFHGDLQGIENWTTERDTLEELGSLGIAPTFEYAPIREGVFYGPTGSERLLRSSRPVFYLVRRGSGPGTLDCGLKAQALGSGAEIRFGESRRELPHGGIVAAGPRRCDAIDVGYVFETDRADGVFAVLSDRLAPKGYAYLLICRGHGTVASCLFADFRNERIYRERTVEFFREKIGLRMTNPTAFGGTGNAFLPRRARVGNLLLAGEAAGFQDALWGFGIRYALLSGHLAARSLIEGTPGQYDRLWKKRFGDLIRTSVVNRYFYDRMGDLGYAALLKRLAHSADIRGRLRGFYAPSSWKTLWFPIARLADWRSPKGGEFAVPQRAQGVRGTGGPRAVHQR